MTPEEIRKLRVYYHKIGNGYQAHRGNKTPLGARGWGSTKALAKKSLLQQERLECTVHPEHLTNHE